MHKIFTENKIDAFLVSGFYNILYLTNFKTLAPQEREAWVLIAENKTYLFSDGRYLDKLKVKSEKLKVEYRLITPEKGLAHHLQEIIRQERIRRLGFEAEDLKFNEYGSLSKKLNGIKLVPLNKKISQLREIKKRDEIQKIKKACEISTRCLKEIIKTVKIGQTEKEIAFRIEYWIKGKGYEAAFDQIVAVDQNTATPHYDTKSGDAKIKKNSILLIDFGSKFQDYCSDMTRIFFVGRPTNELENIYNKLLDVQKKTTKQISQVLQLKAMDRFCRRELQKNGLPNFPHSTGHGLGLEVHEFPSISSKSKDKVVENQVFTIEPGAYYPGKFGMRIEDTILVGKDNQPIILTKFPKEAIII